MSSYKNDMAIYEANKKADAAKKAGVAPKAEEIQVGDTLRHVGMNVEVVVTAVGDEIVASVPSTGGVVRVGKKYVERLLRKV